MQRLKSVKPLDKTAAEHALTAQRLAEKMEKDSHVINAIVEALEQGNLLKTDLVKIAHEDRGISKTRINKVLNDYTGIHFNKGHRWHLIPGEKNAKTYSILRNLFESPQTTASAYRAAKQGKK
jgi:NADH:ubiquinone oxidoreductase subunit E